MDRFFLGDLEDDDHFIVLDDEFAKADNYKNEDIE